MKKAMIPGEKRSPSQGNSCTSTSTKPLPKQLIQHVRLGQSETFTIMRKLNICRLSARIHDPHNAGYKIITNRIKMTDEWGRIHRGFVVYTLTAEPGARVTA